MSKTARFLLLPNKICYHTISSMKQRNFGLDLLRAAAILFVLFNHVLNYFITFDRSTIIGDIAGILGVEIFFVLSGFLIGKILLETFHADMTHGHMKIFYLRRWFRTLPLYYFLLIIFIIVTAITTQTLDLHLFHFVFLQNFFPLDFFSISWSLAIEEWFYFLTPIILFFSYKLKFLTKKTVYLLLLIVLGTIALRMLYVVFFDPSFDEVRKHVFFRFDSLIIGVLLAGVKLHMNGFYKKLQKPLVASVAFFALAFVAYEFMRYYAQISLDPPFFVNVFALPMVSVIIALIIPFFETNALINTRIATFTLLRNAIVWTSLLSYSLYLIHLSMFDLVRTFLPKDTQPLLLTGLGLMLAFAASYLLYRFIEKPFMDMRKKFSGKYQTSGVKT